MGPFEINYQLTLMLELTHCLHNFYHYLDQQNLKKRKQNKFRNLKYFEKFLLLSRFSI